MKYRYIAIEREYGSGGTEIGRRLAEECGIKCYGKEILEEASQKMNTSVEDIQRNEENVTNSFLYTVFAIGQMQAGRGDLLADDGKLFVAEQDFIRETALVSSAVYLGHCASEALPKGATLKVFIRCSDKKAKENRILHEYGISTMNAEATYKRFNYKRAKYYYANTTRKWDDFRNYDLVLDSGTLGVAGCVTVLKALLEQS